MDDSTIVEKVVKPLLAKNSDKPHPREYWKKVMNANLIFELVFRMVICGGIWLIVAHYSQEFANYVLFALLLVSVKSHVECRNSHVLSLIYQELDKNSKNESDSALTDDQASNSEENA